MKRQTITLSEGSIKNAIQEALEEYKNKDTERFNTTGKKHGKEGQKKALSRIENYCPSDKDYLYHSKDAAKGLAVRGHNNNFDGDEFTYGDFEDDQFLHDHPTDPRGYLQKRDAIPTFDGGIEYGIEESNMKKNIIKEWYTEPEPREVEMVAQILDDNEADEMSVEMHMSPEKAAALYFGEIYAESETETETMPKYADYVDTVDGFLDIYHDYGANYYFAVYNKRKMGRMHMNESKKNMKKKINESQLRSIIRNVLMESYWDNFGTPPWESDYDTYSPDGKEVAEYFYDHCDGFDNWIYQNSPEYKSICKNCIIDTDRIMAWGGPDDPFETSLDGAIYQYLQDGNVDAYIQRANEKCDETAEYYKADDDFDDEEKQQALAEIEQIRKIIANPEVIKKFDEFITEKATEYANSEEGCNDRRIMAEPW